MQIPRRNPHISQKSPCTCHWFLTRSYPCSAIQIKRLWTCHCYHNYKDTSARLHRAPHRMGVWRRDIQYMQHTHYIPYMHCIHYIGYVHYIHDIEKNTVSGYDLSYRSIELLSCWALDIPNLLRCWVIGLSSYWFVKIEGDWAIELLNHWAIGLRTYWAIELLSYRDIKLVIHRTLKLYSFSELSKNENAYTFAHLSSRWTKKLTHSHCWALDDRKSSYICTAELSMSEKVYTFARLSSQWSKQLIHSHFWALDERNS